MFKVVVLCFSCLKLVLDWAGLDFQDGRFSVVFPLLSIILVESLSALELLMFAFSSVSYCNS